MCYNIKGTKPPTKSNTLFHNNTTFSMDCTNPTSSSSNKSKEKKGAKKSNKGAMRLSTDPQSVAARERRHRISDRFKILQSMVPGGSKMDTVSMLEGAIHYVEFLKTQIWLHQALINFVDVDHESHMFLPAEYNFSDEHTVFSLQQYPSSSVSVHSQQSLPQLPLAQCCFQGEEDCNTFDATMKYWPA